MPQSLHCKYGHLIFSTKNREPMISGKVEKRLYEYIGGIVRGVNASLIEINGMPDHVHLLMRESKSISDQDFVGQLKGDSSRWMNHTIHTFVRSQSFSGRPDTDGSAFRQRISKAHGSIFELRKRIIRRLRFRKNTYNFLRNMRSNLTSVTYGTDGRLRATFQAAMNGLMKPWPEGQGFARLALQAKAE